MDANLITNSLERGLSTGLSTMFLNLHRRTRNPPEPQVSYSAVNNWVKASPFIKQLHRGSKKAGTTNVDSAWASARLADVQTRCGGKASAQSSRVPGSALAHKQFHFFTPTAKKGLTHYFCSNCTVQGAPPPPRHTCTQHTHTK